MLVALYTTCTAKIEKRRVRMLFLIALLVSMLTGVILPLEIMLAVTAPLLFAMHIFVTGVIFGVCQAMYLNLGFAFAGKTAAAMPGNLFDLLVYVRNINAYQTIMGIMTLGAICFVLYFVMTKVYYYFLALDLFNTGLTRKKIDGFSVAVGGIENIKMVNSSPFRLYVQVYDTNLIDYNQFKTLGASRILETRAGYAIDFGAGSTIYRRELTKRMKECKRRLEN
jgi:phosphotransferase system IIB component